MGPFASRRAPAILAIAAMLGFAACVLDSSGTVDDRPGSGAASSASSSSSSGGGGPEGGEGGGEPTPCQPGTQIACYGGPDGTRNVGACTDGVAECNPSGTGYGTCVGDRKPQTEDCTTAADDSCDGTADCIGKVTGLLDFGEADEIDGLGLTTAGDDAVAVCGVHGEWLRQACDDFDIGVARFEADASVVFEHRFGADGKQVASGATRDAANRLWLTGYFDPELDFGGGPLPDDDNAGTQNFWVARFDASGQYQWSQAFGAENQDDEALGIAAGVEADDGVALVGSFHGALDLGGGTTLTDQGQGDVFVMRLDDDGTVGLAKAFGDGGEQHATSVARFEGGDMVVTGYYRSTLDFGGGPIAQSSDFGFFVARLHRDGTHVWSHGYGGPGDDFADAVAAAPDGGTVFVGHIATQEGTVLDGACGTVEGAGPNRNAFAFKLDANGACVWAHRWGTSGEARAHGVAVDGAGQTVIVGGFDGTMKVGNVTHESEGAGDGFVIKLDANGEVLWSRRFGDASSEQRAFRVATLPAGDIWLLGTYRGEFAIDGVPLGPAASKRAFLMRITP